MFIICMGAITCIYRIHLIDYVLQIKTCTSFSYAFSIVTANYVLFI